MMFNGKGKKSAWMTWKSLSTVTEGFTAESSSAFVPQDTSSPVFSVIEQFTCVMYDSTTQHSKVNDLRQELFPNRVKLMERLPPTQNALLQHVNRWVYQASIWTESLKPVIAAPSPDGFGWSKSDTGWHPIWTTLPAAAVASRELIKCGCKAVPMCARNCKCENAGLACMSLVWDYVNAVVTVKHDVPSSSRLAFLHLHFLLQPFWHLQETSSRQTLEASGSVVQRGPEPVPSHGLQEPESLAVRRKTHTSASSQGACQSHLPGQQNVNCADENHLVDTCEHIGRHATSKRLSASSWLQGARAAVSRNGGLLKTSSPSVMTISFLHLHFLLQPFWHLQETSSRQTLEASGSVVQRGSYISLVLIQPQSVGDGNVGAETRA
ncbi:hypothetical protein GWK47_006835 [Chionoecetes opilio]|uniref:Uncharacterized protein n=1 Tax=Chionoecetes opilio TaxID=41210 RepID=A0A8J5CTY1_CHIOP|nr:hypothetical protein GWK47_006835 [Chionoecetes opilio]